MVLAKSFAENVVAPLILDQISNGLENRKLSLREKYTIYRIKKDINKWTIEYCKQHDGTILTEGRFASLLEEYHIIERIFTYSQTANVEMSEEDFINDLIMRSKRGISGRLSVLDESEMKNFYVEVLNQYRKKWLTQLSFSEKQIIRSVTSEGEKLYKAIGTIEKKYQPLLDRKILPISEKDAISLFRVFDGFFKEGKFDLLEEIMPAIEGKNESLELWVKSILASALYENAFSISESDIRRIAIRELHDDAIRKKVAFSILENKKIDIFECNNEDLSELIAKINEGETSIIFSVQEEIKNHTKIMEFKMMDRYKNEQWLLNLYLLHYLMNHPAYKMYESVNSLLQDHLDYITRLILAMMKLMSSPIYVLENKDNTCEEEFNAIWKSRDVYTKSTSVIAKLFFEFSLKYSLTFSRSMFPSVVSLIPQYLLEEKEITELTIIGEIINGQGNLQKIISFCNRFKDNRCLISYCANSNFNAEESLRIMNDNFDLLSEDPISIFFYVDTLRAAGKIEVAKRILEEKRVICESYIEYWTINAELNPSDENLCKLEQVWLQGNIKNIPVSSDIKVMQVLCNNGHFGVCIEIANALEERGIINNDASAIKATCLIQKGNKVAAYRELLHLYDRGCATERVIYNLLGLAIELKRDVSENLLIEAKKIKTSYMYLLIGSILQRKGQDDYIDIFEQSLLLNQGENDQIYGVYWNAKILQKDVVRKIDCVQESTAIYLKKNEDGTVHVVSIYNSENLFEDKYTWNNAFFITKEEAIKLELYRKKKNNRCKIDGNEYVITNIIPLEMFLCQVCSDKIVSSGHAKECKLPIGDDLDENRKLLVEWYKENIGENKSTDLLESYKDFNEMPAPFFSLTTVRNWEYEECIREIIENKQLVIREQFDFKKDLEFEFNTKFVLSYSATVLLFLLGIDDSELLKDRVYIPKSMAVEAVEQKDKILKSYDRNNVSSLVLQDDNLFIYNTTEEIKARQMKYAVDFADFCSKISQIENDSSISIEQLDESKLLQYVGIVDYDAIALCQNSKYVFVSIEQLLSSVALSVVPKVIVSDAISFLNGLVDNDITLVKYLRQCVEYRMINIINRKILTRFIKNNTQEFLDEFVKFLQEIDKTSGDYRELLRIELITNGQKIINSEFDDILQGSLAWRAYFSLLLKLNELKIATSYENGVLTFGLIHEPYDDYGDSVQEDSGVVEDV